MLRHPESKVAVMRTTRNATLRVFNPKMLPILFLLFPLLEKLSNFPLDQGSNLKPPCKGCVAEKSDLAELNYFFDVLYLAV